MKALLIAALSVVVMLAGCASSRTFQLKQERAADNSRSRIKHIKLQRAAEIAKEVLEENNYFVTHFEWEANHYACVRSTRSVAKGWILSDSHNYRAEIRITKKDQGHRYEVSSYWKYNPWLDLNPLGAFRPYHRDEKEEKKILDCIEKKCQ
ncbi:MAG TPA: hypothetical protein VMY06_12425 [Sedimentisphaerales bacterium]|nr:hypothetical protein [Sedimentisphaerales bacterium]